VQGDVRVPGRGYQLFLLTIAMATGGYVQNTVSPLQETIRVGLALSDHQMAVLQGPALGIPMMLVAIPLGLLIDRYSRARLLTVFVAVGVGGSVLTAFASDFSTLLLARGLAGLGGFGSVPIVFSLLADLYPPVQRGRVTSLVTVGQVVGSAAAFALGGALVSTNSDPEGWQRAMFWLVVPVVPVALAMLKTKEPLRTGVTITNPTVRQVWNELGQHRNLVVSLIAGFVLVQIAVGAILTWASPMLSRDFGIAQDRVGTIMAVGTLFSGILGPIAGGLLADVCQSSGGPRRSASVLCGLALLSAPLGLFAFASGAVTISVLLIAAITLLLVIALMAITLVTIVAPNELRGLCMSALAAVSMLFGVAAAPLAVSLLSDALGGMAMIGKALSLICVAASVFAAVAFAFARRHIR